MKIVNKTISSNNDITDIKKARAILLVLCAITFGIAFASTFYYLPAIGLMVLFPMMWLSWPNRQFCFTFIFSFYLWMNWEEIPDALKFFANDHMNINIAILIWLAHSLFMSIPWVVCYSKNRKLKNLLIRTFLITVVLFIPPLGYFVWLQPITAAGILFPGLGWLGLALTIILMLFFVALRFSWVIKQIFKIVLLLVLGLLFLALFVNLNYVSPKPPQGWVAINTNFGEAPANLFSQVYREFALINLAQESLNQGYKVILFPENIATDWLPGTQSQWQAISNEAKNKGASIILGAQLDYADWSHDNIFIILGKDGGRIYPARQPMPLGLWHPWGKGNYHAHWLLSGRFTLKDQEVVYLICYEQMVPWPFFSSFIFLPKPSIIISSANQWFSIKSGFKKQYNVLLANARIFNVYHLMALNL